MHLFDEDAKGILRQCENKKSSKLNFDDLNFLHCRSFVVVKHYVKSFKKFHQFRPKLSIHPKSIVPQELQLRGYLVFK